MNNCWNKNELTRQFCKEKIASKNVFYSNILAAWDQSFFLVASMQFCFLATNIDQFLKNVTDYIIFFKKYFL